MTLEQKKRTVIQSISLLKNSKTEKGVTEDRNKYG